MSRPEETLEKLADLAREDEALTTALERAAQRSNSEPEPLLENVPQVLLEPLAERQQLDLAAAIQARLAAKNGAIEPAPAAERKRAAARGEPRSRRARIVAIGGSAIVALAAGMLLWLGRPADPAADFPLYDAQVAGGRQSERGNAEPKASLELRPGSKLEFTLRPRTDFPEAVRARAFAETTNGERLELELTQEQSAAGALRVQARVPDRVPERGELVLIIGRPSTLESSSESSRDPEERDPQRFSWSFARAP